MPEKSQNSAIGASFLNTSPLSQHYHLPRSKVFRDGNPRRVCRAISFALNYAYSYHHDLYIHNHLSSIPHSTQAYSGHRSHPSHQYRKPKNKIMCSDVASTLKAGSYSQHSRPHVYPISCSVIEDRMWFCNVTGISEASSQHQALMNVRKIRGVLLRLAAKCGLLRSKTSSKVQSSLLDENRWL